MKLFNRKKKNNKGFSLVELIVVVAIMAVLMGVLVPTLIRNVEKSKIQKDKSAVAEIANAMTVALASEEYSDLDVVLTVTGNVTAYTTTVFVPGTSDDRLTAYLEEVGKSVKAYSMTSKKYKASGTTAVFTIKDGTVTATLGEDTVTG